MYKEIKNVECTMEKYRALTQALYNGIKVVWEWESNEKQERLYIREIEGETYTNTKYDQNCAFKKMLELIHSYGTVEN